MLLTYEPHKINSNRFVVLSNDGYRLKQVIVGDMLQKSTTESIWKRQGCSKFDHKCHRPTTRIIQWRCPKHS